MELNKGAIYIEEFLEILNRHRSDATATFQDIMDTCRNFRENRMRKALRLDRSNQTVNTADK